MVISQSLACTIGYEERQAKDRNVPRLDRLSSTGLPTPSSRLVHFPRSPHNSASANATCSISSNAFGGRGPGWILAPIMSWCALGELKVTPPGWYTTIPWNSSPSHPPVPLPSLKICTVSPATRLRKIADRYTAGGVPEQQTLILQSWQSGEVPGASRISLANVVQSRGERKSSSNVGYILLIASLSIYVVATLKVSYLSSEDFLPLFLVSNLAEVALYVTICKKFSNLGAWQTIANNPEGSGCSCLT
jgi:hypothetical protein